ncbi:hypothetical protein E3N88_05538 [Mikania micrantha]|uniref:Lipoyl-binding domain-containing protein n=1 Tax=Mikania micrantha TaxID=192012 RepID=A0A5N6PLZ4_9ASTR|nr:hypothetical protein E3N88_05538 [Mikania micrantha]
MAACSFGPSTLKLCSLRLGPATVELANLQQNYHGLWFRSSLRFDGLVLSQRSVRTSYRCLCLPAMNAQSGTDLQDSSEVGISSESTSQLTPNASEVESLLADICDTTSIAEFELKLGGFRLYVLRNLAGESTSSPPPVSAPVISANVNPIDQNGSASSPSLAITKVEPTSGGIQRYLDTAADEGLTIIQSPRVRNNILNIYLFNYQLEFFYKKICNLKQVVKEGQVICYIEQLGGELPIEILWDMVTL